MPVLTREQERALRGLFENDVGYIATFFSIPNKDKVTVPFVPKQAQLRILRELRARHLVVKPSQVGSTSIASALFMKRTMTQPNTTSVVVSHKGFLSQRLLQRTQLFYDSTPETMRPRQDHSSSHEKRFPDINSVMYIGTAGADDFGRGEPIHNLLFSEAAFYPKGAWENIVLPAMQRVPPGGTVIFDSTPNGEDEIIYPLVQDILRGESPYGLTVIYWWEEPDNVLPHGDMVHTLAQDRYDLVYTPEELALIARAGLSEDQVRWRRWKIREMRSMFWQEHLEGLDTCFLTTHNPYYDPDTLTALGKLTLPAPHGYEGAHVWRQPQDKIEYVIGVDPGQGKITQSVAEVVHIEGERVVHDACLEGYFPPEVMSVKCARLGLYYNTALIIPEANSQGLGLCADLRRSYPRLYFRRDVISGRSSMQVGWLTSGHTKPFMMEEMQRRLPHLDTLDTELVRQLKGWQEVGVGKLPVSQVADDHHDAACLAMVALISAGSSAGRGYRGSSGWNW